MSVDRKTAMEIMFEQQEAQDLAHRTADFIASIPAGPDLDRLVAEKAMGWPTILASVRGKLGFPTDKAHIAVFDIGPRHPPGFCVRSDRWVYEDEDWSPSISMAYAWDVVEMMHAKGWRLSLWHVATGWYCEMETDIGARSCDGAASAPLAICRAALLAVGA